jgi:hypothetical protein
MMDALLWIASLALAMTSEMTGIAAKLAPMRAGGNDEVGSFKLCANWLASPFATASPEGSEIRRHPRLWM